MFFRSESPTPSRVAPEHGLALAFVLLLQAREYAQRAGRSSWDFAIERSLLLRAGLTINDLRWLVYSGYLECAREATKDNDNTRVFCNGGAVSAITGRNCCFVLTDAGEAYLLSLRNGTQTLSKIWVGVSSQDTRQTTGDLAAYLSQHSTAASSVRCETGGAPPLPSWDSHRRELYFGGELIKKFKIPSPNQEQILTVFEEENWPVRIDDPLSCLADSDPKQRLRETIRSLIRNQR
jgi:hypothetical protein